MKQWHLASAHFRGVQSLPSMWTLGHFCTTSQKSPFIAQASALRIRLLCVTSRTAQSSAARAWAPARAPSGGRGGAAGAELIDHTRINARSFDFSPSALG